MELNYLGPSGTFSEEATRWFSARLDVDADRRVPRPSISETLNAVSDEAFAIVPYYNLIDGLISETMDRVLQENLRIRAALRIAIRIAAAHGERLEAGAPVFSHPKALAQCSDYLSREHSARERVPVASTAEGIERAFHEGGIALASMSALTERAARILVEDATNDYMGRANYTEFLLVSNRTSDVEFPSAGSTESRCVLACDPQDDRPGLLAGMLSQFAFFHLNLARLHARPARTVTPTQMDPQIFFMEIASGIPGNHRETLLKALSIGLSGSTDSDPKLLGEYPLFDLTSPP